MNEPLAIILFTIWYVLALIVSERYGKNAKPGVEWLFFISMLLSPIIGFVVAKLKSKSTLV